jgi:hypothetical protein
MPGRIDLMSDGYKADQSHKHLILCQDIHVSERILFPYKERNIRNWKG